MRTAIIAISSVVVVLSACKKDKDEEQPAPTSPSTITVTDIDGTVYSTVTVGSQVWMKENLRTTRYRDGSAIPEVQANPAWQALNTGAWCNYGNYAPNNTTYGKLYNWHAVIDARGLCPQGWHVPTDAEWKSLEMSLGMLASEVDLTDYRGDAQSIGGKMKAVDQLWEPPNEGATNSSGFSGLPGGHRNEDGTFTGVRYYGDWWSASPVDATYAWGRSLDNEDPGIYRYDDLNKKDGLCVRCLQD